MTINDGGQAFPRAGGLGDGWEGMSLRDFMASKFAAAMVANEAYIAFSRGFHSSEKGHDSDPESRSISDRGYDTLVREAYILADKMLIEREASR